MSYDPFQNLTTPPGSDLMVGYDPYQHMAISTPSKFDVLQRRGPTFEGWEQRTAAWSPTGYALVHTALDLVPFMKYVLPSEQKDFEELDAGGKAVSLGMETLGAALWFAGPAIGKGVRTVLQKPAGWLIGKAQYAPKMLPIEDAISGISKLDKAYNWEAFSYTKQASSKLRSMGFAEDEANAIASYMAGGSVGGLKDLVLEKTFMGKAMSKAWGKNVEFSGTMYGGLQPKGSLMEKLNERLMRQRHSRIQFRKALSEEVFHGPYPKGYPESAFKRYLRRFGVDAEDKVLADATEEETANFILDMLRDTRGLRGFVAPGAGRLWPTILSPTRVIFGTGEDMFFTFSKIYKPTAEAFSRAAQEQYDKILVWLKMLEQRGLGEVKFDKYGAYHFRPKFKPAEADEAYKILTTVDELMEAGRKTGEEKLFKAAEELLASKKGTAYIDFIIDSWYDYSDTLYAEHMIHKIPNILKKAGLTETGSTAVDALMADLSPRITELFSTSGTRAFATKEAGVQRILAEIRGLIDPGDLAKHPWFKAEGAQLQRLYKTLQKEFHMGKGGEWLQYLSNYVARLSMRGRSMTTRWSSALSENARAFFTKKRVLQARKDEPVDFASMIEARTRAHAKELYVYDQVSDVVRYAKRLPIAWQEQTEHFLSRAFNRPSIIDYKVALWLDKSIGRFTGDWDEHRVLRLAQTINNFTYMGALGFKPFSAMRNLFQPLINVPADLGGFKNYADLLQGMRRAFSADFRRQVHKLGIIAEYAPEVTARPAALPWKNIKIGKRIFHTPRSSRVRDGAMWMFRLSDRWNRYVTAGAAFNRWEKAARQFISHKSINKFLKEAGVTRRNPWIKSEIENLIRGRNAWDEAKKIFVRDVVADTQYLYGAIDAPLITSRAGALSRTGFVFHSWWMNYGTLIDKMWRTNATVDELLNRQLTWMTSQAIAITLMTALWGEATAKRSTVFGPFPVEISEFSIPPTWTPIYRAMRTIKAAAQRDPDMTAQQAKEILKSSTIFVPGGLQLEQLARGASEGGLEGLLKAIGRLK